MYNDLVNAVFKLNDFAGKDIWKTIQGTLNMSMNRYFGTRGHLGLGMDTPQGEGINHEEATRALEGLIDTYNQNLETPAGQNAELNRQLAVLGKIDPRGAEKMITDILDVTREARLAIDEIKNLLKDDSDVAKVMRQVKRFQYQGPTRGSKDEAQGVNQQNKIATKILRQSYVEGASERVSDAQQEQLAQAEVTTSDAILQVNTHDSNTGYNSDAKADKSINSQQATNRIADQNQKILNDIVIALSGVLTVMRNKGLLSSDKSANNLQKDGTQGTENKLSIDACESMVKILTDINTNVSNILQTLVRTSGYIPTNSPALVPGEGPKSQPVDKEPWEDKTDWNKLHAEKLNREVDADIDTAIWNHAWDIYESEAEKAAKEAEEQKAAAELKALKEKRIKESMIPTSTAKASTSEQTPKTFLDGLKSIFKPIKTPYTAEQVMSMSQSEVAKLRGEMINTFGVPYSSGNPTATGDIGRMRRSKNLWRNDGKRDLETDPFKDLKLTPGISFNLNDTMFSMQNMIQKNMFDAQTGGGGLRNLLGSMTLYLGMPSFEKSRAEIDGMNQIMANIREAATELLNEIKREETDLRGMERAGTATFNDKGVLTGDSSDAAVSVFVSMEEHKKALQSVLAEMVMVDQLVDATNGNVSEILRHLGFVTPQLMKNNVIIENINAGLDKTGKVLKFQRRTQEIMNYAYQLMARHIGQMFKNLLMAINPVRVLSNLVRKISQTIKSAFQDFASYDVKWQRTLNVIKYNFRAIIRPAMQWIAQSLTNIIGFFDIISMKIQAAFGKVPVSLFDQTAANAEKIREELEEAANVTAGFDELHDISGETAGGGSAAMDLMGEIYKPQLPDEWVKLAEKLGDVFGKLFTGDMGFGEAMSKILDLAWDGAQKLWDIFKNSSLGQGIIDAFKTLLDKLLQIFVAWQLLKIAGKLLWDAITSHFNLAGFGSLLGSIGSWFASGITTALASSTVGSAILSIGSGMLLGVRAAFNGIGLIDTLKSAFLHPDLIASTMGWGKMLGVIFTQAFGVALGAATVAKGFDMNADTGSYNWGLREAGGNKEDEKSYAAGNVLGAVGGGLIGLFLVGGPLALGIGAIAGLVVTSLAPAMELFAIKAKEAANEMQKMEYYQGLVQGYSTQVDNLTELESVLTDTLKAKTETVINEGIQLGHTKERMVELTNAVIEGTFSTNMLKTSEQGLTEMLMGLNAQQVRNAEVTTRLEEAKRKLQKAEIDLAIAEDVAAGNFELAAARIEYAEAAMLYTEEEATKKRIQLYKEASTMEGFYLLQDWTPEQRDKMANINNLTKEELASYVKHWNDSSDAAQEAFLQGLSPEVADTFRRQMDDVNSMIEEQQGFWRALADTILEVFTLGIWDTWTYNGEVRASKQVSTRSTTIPSMDIGTNYVPNDGLAYLHQGEAVIPKRYNNLAYTPSDNSSAILEMTAEVARLRGMLDQGINVKGEFKQRGSDLVAVVEKGKNKNGNQALSNPAYAR